MNPTQNYNNSVINVLRSPTIIPAINPLYTGNSFVLNQIPGAVAAYALRKLNYNAQFAIRVRRSTDNVEMDIGFVNNNLDTSTLLAFINGASGYVKTWYDQSGNGYDITQSTTTKQPQIVNSGSVNTNNLSKPCVTYISANQTGLFSGTSSISSICSMNIVSNNPNSNRTFGFGDSTLDTNLILGLGNTGSAFAVGSRLPTNQLITFGTGTEVNTSIISYLRDTTVSQSVWKNGTLAGTNTNATTTFTGTKIGMGYLATTSPVYSDAKVSEAFIFSPLTDTQRKFLESNQSKFYGITIT